MIDDPIDTEEDAKSEAYDECKQLTHVGNKVRNNVEEQRPHVRRQKELSNTRRQKPWTSLTSSRHSASPNSSTHDDDEAGFAVGTTFGAAVGTTVLSSTSCATLPLEGSVAVHPPRCRIFVKPPHSSSAIVISRRRFLRMTAGLGPKSKSAVVYTLNPGDTLSASTNVAKTSVLSVTTTLLPVAAMWM